MINKRVLIFAEKTFVNARSGGPAGYLYPFLSMDQKEVNGVSLFFLPDKTLSELVYRPRFDRKRNSKNQALVALLNQFDYVYFHSAYDLWSCRVALKDFEGKTILQEHGPKPPFLEFIEDYPFFRGGMKNRLRRHILERRDRFAFRRTDYMVFPCPEAKESYIKRWPWFHRNISLINAKARYLLTGIVPPGAADRKIIERAEALRKKHGIPNETIVLLFIGRHLPVKGYDVFEEIAKLYAEDPRIVFMCCGTYDPKRAAKHAGNFIELGRTDDVFAVIESADYVCSFSKDTYYDLSVLEFLGMGKKGILSYTGGNKIIAELFGNDLFFYSSKDELVGIIRDIVCKPRPRPFYENILETFNSFCTAEKMLDGWYEMISSLNE